MGEQEAKEHDKRWHEPFLEILRGMPNIRNALKRLGVTREKLVEHRALDRRFDAAVDMALEDGRDNLRMMIAGQAVGVQQADGSYKGRSERLLALVARMYLPEFGGAPQSPPGDRGRRDDDERPTTPTLFGGGDDAEFRPPRPPAAEAAEPAGETHPAAGSQEAAEEGEPGGAAIDYLERELEEMGVVAPQAPDEEDVQTDDAKGPRELGLFSPPPHPAPQPPPFRPSSPVVGESGVQRWQVAAIASIRERALEVARSMYKGKRLGYDTPAIVERGFEAAAEAGAVQGLQAIAARLARWKASASGSERKDIASIEADAAAIEKTIRQGGV